MYCAGRFNTIQYNTIQYCAILSNTIRYATHYNIAKEEFESSVANLTKLAGSTEAYHITIQYNTIQYNTM